MFGELFVLLRFKLNSPVESRPRVGSGVQEPAEQPQHEAGAASVVGSDLDVASHVYHQLWQRQGRGNQTVSFTPGSASHAGTCDLAASWSCQHASRPRLNQTGSMCRSHGISLHQHLQEFQLTSKMISGFMIRHKEGSSSNTCASLRRCRGVRCWMDTGACLLTKLSLELDVCDDGGCVEGQHFLWRLAGLRIWNTAEESEERG